MSSISYANVVATGSNTPTSQSDSSEITAEAITQSLEKSEAASTAEATSNIDEKALPSPTPSPKVAKVISLAPAPVPEVSAWGSAPTSRSNSNVDAKSWPSPLDAPQQNGAAVAKPKIVTSKSSKEKWVPFKASVVLSQPGSNKKNTGQKRNSQKSNTTVNNNSNSNTNTNNNTNSSSNQKSNDAKKRKNKSEKRPTQSQNAQQQQQQQQHQQQQSQPQAQQQQQSQHKEESSGNIITPAPPATVSIPVEQLQTAPSQEATSLEGQKVEIDDIHQHQHQHRQFHKHNNQNQQLTPQQNFNQYQQQFYPQNQQPFLRQNRTFNNNSRRYNKFNQANGYVRNTIQNPNFTYQNRRSFNDNPYAFKNDPLFSLIKQVEYYFSIDNLVKDIYLRKQMNDEGWLPLNIIANFHRMSTLSVGDVNLIRRSIDQLNGTVLEIGEFDNDVLKIRAKENWKNWILPASQRDAPGVEETKFVKLIIRQVEEPNAETEGDVEVEEQFKEETPVEAAETTEEAV